MCSLCYNYDSTVDIVGFWYKITIQQVTRVKNYLAFFIVYLFCIKKGTLSKGWLE
jgi:hypothetical protein